MRFVLQMASAAFAVMGTLLLAQTGWFVLDQFRKGANFTFGRIQYAVALIVYFIGATIRETSTWHALQQGGGKGTWSPGWVALGLFIATIGMLCIIAASSPKETRHLRWTTVLFAGCMSAMATYIY